jgi:3-methyladenine DNA glycosylase/8-oxoguanine DNA glycosylase
VQHELRVEVRPPWPFRLPGGSADGLTRRRGASLQRLLHHNGAPVHVAVIQPAPDRVIFGARAAAETDAMWGIRRLRFATGVDDDLREFHETFGGDDLIGRAMRAHPTLRPVRKPSAFEALTAAITEQLIDIERAIAIQRRIVARLGRRCERSGLRDAATAAALAGEAPARLVSFGLAETRVFALRRAARAVASGAIDLDERHEASWQRLLAIPGIGPWTVEYMALHGQGRHDQVPAADLGFLKLVGRLLTGRPRAYADEAQVRALLEPYGSWRGLAGEYLMWAGRRGLLPSR